VGNFPFAGNSSPLQKFMSRKFSFARGNFAKFNKVLCCRKFLPPRRRYDLFFKFRLKRKGQLTRGSSSR
jgi:hypothetical protein